MDEKAFRVIKLQLDEEKQEIEREIVKLQEKQNESIQTKINELEKLNRTSKQFESSRVVAAGSLYQNYRYDVVKKAEKDIATIENFIGIQKVELEKLKEKEKEVMKIFEIGLRKKLEVERRSEEIKAMEYKILMKRRKGK